MIDQEEQQKEAQADEVMDERSMLARVMDEYVSLTEQQLADAKALARNHIANFRVVVEACDRLMERHQNRRALAEAEAASKH